MPSVPNHPFDAYQGAEPYIFVSYSHRDGEIVFQQINRLNQLGYRIWYDEGIAPGFEWAAEVSKALKKADQFVVFLSKDAVDSENVRNEINLALDKKIPFLAIHLGEVELTDGLDLRTASKQAILHWQLSDEHYRRKMAKALLPACLGLAPQLGKQRSQSVQQATKRFRVLISGPGDVRSEREIASRVISRVEGGYDGKVKIEGYFWENQPMMASPRYLSPDPATFDLVVGILWSRLGVLPHVFPHGRPDGTPYASATEYELERAILAYRNSGRPDLLIYLRREAPRLLPKPGQSVEQQLKDYEALMSFIHKWFLDEETGAFRFAFNNYQDDAEFEKYFEAHLQKLVGKFLETDG